MALRSINYMPKTQQNHLQCTKDPKWNERSSRALMRLESSYCLGSGRAIKDSLTDMFIEESFRKINHTYCWILSGRENVLILLVKVSGLDHFIAIFSLIKRWF